MLCSFLFTGIVKSWRGIWVFQIRLDGFSIWRPHGACSHFCHAGLEKCVQGRPGFHPPVAAGPTRQSFRHQQTNVSFIDTRPSHKLSSTTLQRFCNNWRPLCIRALADATLDIFGHLWTIKINLKHHMEWYGHIMTYYDIEPPWDIQQRTAGSDRRVGPQGRTAGSDRRGHFVRCGQATAWRQTRRWAILGCGTMAAVRWRLSASVWRNNGRKEMLNRMRHALYAINIYKL